jgi:hypothetical protein
MPFPRAIQVRETRPEAVELGIDHGGVVPGGRVPPDRFARQ